MKLSKKTQSLLDANNLYLTCGGGFRKTYYLEDRDVLTGFRTTHHVRRKEVGPEDFKSWHPHACLTGVYNEFGHERCVTAYPTWKSAQVWNAKQVERLAKAKANKCNQ
ncbi:hypothetical protein [Lewinella sp. W8]|uniref:hypothetical protein n=1 Tax=Lewinella sp. W8 TaxID=2528208 RepID=UPI0010674209|nr:hypothetical protein [Lewinella sp. W8]MTB53032.1 hypothetical protein [Lewinella sp. W8]